MFCTALQFIAAQNWGRTNGFMVPRAQKVRGRVPMVKTLVYRPCRCGCVEAEPRDHTAEYDVRPIAPPTNTPTNINYTG